MAKVLEFSVGPGGVNRHSDVVKLQEFLNELTPDEGGPVHKLHVTGIFTPQTAEALHEFIWFEDWSGPGDVNSDVPRDLAHLGSRLHSSLKIPGGIDLEEVEEIGFTFGKIQITFSDGSKAFGDHWH